MLGLAALLIEKIVQPCAQIAFRLIGINQWMLISLLELKHLLQEVENRSARMIDRCLEGNKVHPFTKNLLEGVDGLRRVWKFEARIESANVVVCQADQGMVFAIFDRLLKCRGEIGIGGTHQGKWLNLEAVGFELVFQSEQGWFGHCGHPLSADQNVMPQIQ